MENKLSKEAYGGVHGKDYVPYINDKSKKGVNLTVLIIGIILSTLFAASTAYSSATALTTSAVEVELNLAKPTSTTAVTKNTWWGIEIPSGTLPGEYTGENTITAIKGETANW